MIQLRSIQYLVVLSEYLNYARAAEKLRITQSALSRSIQALEKQSGTRLVDRDRSGVALTPQGRLIVEEARVLLANAADLERLIAHSADGQAGRLRFGMAPMPARALLGTVLSERLERTPQVVHDVIVRDTDALWSRLLSGDIEFFVSQDGLITDASAVRTELLGHFPLSLIVRPGHPLLHGDGHGVRYPLLRSSWLGVPLPPSIEGLAQGAPQVIEDYGALAAITASTDAIWFSSSHAVRDALQAGTLCALPEPADLAPREVRVVIYTLNRRSQSPLMRSFKDSLRRHARALGRLRIAAPG
jgi:DNA-binding transcriptional LysR family regulator